MVEPLVHLVQIWRVALRRGQVAARNTRFGPRSPRPSGNKGVDMGKPSIGVIGGTGPQGKGLGYRFALAGHPVTLGSRAEERAAGTAGEINARLTPPVSQVRGASNEKAAEASDI